MNVIHTPCTFRVWRVPHTIFIPTRHLLTRATWSQADKIVCLADSQDSKQTWPRYVWELFEWDDWKHQHRQPSWIYQTELAKGKNYIGPTKR